MDWNEQIAEGLRIIDGQGHTDRKAELKKPSPHLHLPEGETFIIQQNLSAEEGLDCYETALDARFEDPEHQRKFDELKPAVQIKIDWARQALAANDAEHAFRAGLDLANSYHFLLHCMRIGEQIAQGITFQMAREGATRESNRLRTERNRGRDAWICRRWDDLCAKQQAGRPMSMNEFRRLLEREFASRGFQEEVVLPGRKGIEKILVKHKKLEPAFRSSNGV
jgi:hypothetical protein